MPRWTHALLVAAAATGVAALVLNMFPGWKEEGGKRQGRRSNTGRHGRARSHEEIIDELSDMEKDQMLRELGQHV